MARNADLTRQRLLDAATVEFAEHGIAGARVDRIAESSGANKSLIYTYFGSKNLLFDAVFGAAVAEVMSHVPFDATDLPGYAGRLVDLWEERPHIQRLSTWYRLERPRGEPLRAIVASNELKLAKIAEAQKSGAVTDEYTPVEVLALVLSAAAAWASAAPALGAARPAGPDRRREMVVNAVRRLTEPR